MSRCIDADELMELLTTAIRNVKGIAKFIGAGDDPEIQMEIKAYTDIANGVKDMPTIEPEPQWIPVAKRLPEPRTDVWVNSDIGQIQGYYEESVETWYASFGQGRDYLELIVNAWMPLPEPYQEEGGQK